MAHTVQHFSRLDARIPQWDTTALAERTCPLCNNTGTAHGIRPDGLTVRLCTSCSLYFISPAPTPEQLDAFYATYNEHHRRNNTTDSYTVEHIRNQQPHADIRIAEIGAHFPDCNGKQVLDVGFGLGSTLVLLQKLGFAVEGIELDDDAIAFVRTRLGISTVRNATIDDVEGQYDVIVLHDLIEHPLAPLQLLRRAVELLRPNGIISLWTPNASAVQNETDPVHFRVDLEHMQYFTFGAMARAAETLGVDIVHMEGIGFPSLRGIDGATPAQPYPQWKRVVKSLPGISHALHLRQKKAAQKAYQHLRNGSYHLFCLLRKPETPRS